MRYFNRGMRRVSGWLNPFSATAIVALGRFQQGLGLAGAVGEIGVHHGKLFLLLHELSDAGRKSIAVDVFDDQHLNVDRSGSGNRARFMTNLERWSERPGDVEILQTSSLALAAEDIIGRVGRLRLGSVDGGHTAECAESDTRLIAAASEPHAVIVVDDYFNPMWPDVSVGVARYCLDPATEFRPFAITPGKLLLARPEWGVRYRALLERQFPWRVAGQQQMFGTTVCQLGITHDNNVLKAMLQRTPLFVYLKRRRERARRSNALSHGHASASDAR